MSNPLTESGTNSEDFSFGERVSMLFGVEAGSLSGLSIALLIGYKMERYRIFLRARAGGKIWEADAADSSLFMTLMVGEILRAIGKIMTITWIVDGKITAPTTYCTAQGVIQLLGTNIIDWSTLAITVQTTVILIARWNTPTHFAKYLVLCVWVIVSLIIGLTLGVRGLDIIGPAGTWCWIQPKYPAEQIVGEYLWMWIILVLTTIAYVINALVIRGFLMIDGWRLRWVSRNRIHLGLTELTEGEEEDERDRRRMAKQLFFYPLVYFICVTPFSITRWLGFAKHPVPHQLAAFTSTLFSLSGLFNVILFFTTRPALFTGGDNIEHGPPAILPDIPSPSKQRGHGQGPSDTSTSALLSHQSMAEKHPEEDMFVEINYSRGREGTGNVPVGRQMSQSPLNTPVKYSPYDDDVGILPP